jgi:probable addiction module antidote protein
LSQIYLRQAVRPSPILAVPHFGLTDILEANDAGLLAAALGDIARARGMAEIAEAAGITREALYKALRPDSAPRFDTVSRVCTALGVRLVAQPMNPRRRASGD